MQIHQAGVIPGKERMPRKKRIWYPGATYHVMSRGNRRTAIYKDEADYCHFLDIIKLTMKEFAFRVHSVCMMTNHFHMEIETSDTELWRIMQKIKSVYAEEFNHRHKYLGYIIEVAGRAENYPFHTAML